MWTNIEWLAMFLEVSFIMCQQFLQSHMRNHTDYRPKTKVLLEPSRGLLALQIKIPLGIHFLGP